MKTSYWNDVNWESDNRKMEFVSGRFLFLMECQNTSKCGTVECMRSKSQFIFHQHKIGFGGSVKIITVKTTSFEKCICILNIHMEKEAIVESCFKKFPSFVEGVAIILCSTAVDFN